MRSGISFAAPSSDRRRLESIVSDGDAPQTHVWRALIVLLTADGVGTNRVIAETGESKSTVLRWRARFIEAGVEALLIDKTRPAGNAPINDDRVAELFG